MQIIYSFIGTVLAFMAIVFLLNHLYGDRIKNISDKFAKIERLLNRFI